jgi:TRAP-type mannitol/chloroaromatic compound transport system substrate-binding protein
MDRRSFLKASALGGGAAAVSSLAAPAIAGGHARTLTMVTSWPRGFAVLDDAATYFNEAVNAMSGGELVIEKKAPGELVGAFEVFDAVTSGQADMYHSADYYFLGQHPGYAFYTAVPFGATAQELTNWYYHDGGQDLHDELGSIFGLKSFLCGNSGSQSGGWFRKEINSAQDLAGLRFRMPGLGGQVLGNWAFRCKTSQAASFTKRCPLALWMDLSGLDHSLMNAQASKKLPRSITQLVSTSQVPVLPAA